MREMLRTRKADILMTDLFAKLLYKANTVYEAKE